MLRLMKISLVMGLVFVLFACSGGGPEEKRAKFYNKGAALYEQGDYVKAALELKNALQVDPKFAQGYYLLGMCSFRRGEFKKAYGTISRPTARKATPKRHAPKRTWRASSKKRSARKPQTRKAIRRTAKRRSR